MSMKQCVDCGKTITSRDRRVRRCYPCSMAHLAERHDKRKREFVEEVRWLLDSGTSPAQVSRQLGVKIPSLQQRLYRYGERELAAAFNPHHRPRDCADCGTPISSRATRCRGCENRHRIGWAA